MERIRSRCASPWILAFVLVVAVGLLVAPTVSVAGTITATVQNTALENVEGVMVQLYFANGAYITDKRTVSDGTVSFTNLDAGSYWLLVDDGALQRYAPQWYNDKPASYAPFVPDTILLPTAASSSSVPVTVKRGVTIHVHVTRPDGATAVESMTVQPWFDWLGTPRNLTYAITDATGECTFTLLPTGSYYVAAQDGHHAPGFGGWPMWYTSGRYPDSPGASFRAEGTSIEWSIKTPMLPKATVGVVGLSDTTTWTQSPTGVVTLDLGMDSDYNPSTLFYRVYPVGGTPPFPWPEWDGSSQPTVTLTEGLHHVEAYGQVDTPPSGDDGNGPQVTRQIGIDNTKPHTTANVGTVSQAFLELKATDPLSGIGYTRYSLDSGADQAYTEGSPVPLTRGSHSVTWYSRDNAGNTEDAHSGTIISGPQAYVTTPRGSSKTRVRRTLSFSGKLTRAANHRRLTLLAYRFNGTDWVLARTKVVTTHTPRRRGMTTYRGSIKFTAKGSWKVIARYEGDGYWVQSYSAPKYVIVR
jgi:hypothetical protein